MLWCTQCRTSIAQAELDSKDSDSAFVTVPFMVDGTSVPVATTRPELLFGCVCLFVHPEDERHINLVGKQARVPLYGFGIPILTDEQVDRNKGTGIVMCATFGDSTDARWYQEHNLPYKKVILPDGRIDESAPLMGGLSIRAARREITRLLEERGLLLGREAITHTVSVHERCGTEVEIIPSKQWYIDILSEKERFLQAADEIEWYPAQMKNRYISWVEGLKWDWCVSRQRYFGVPIPLWYCKECGQAIPAQEDRLPVNPREEGPGYACTCGCNDFIPETSVMDTWATSSLTPQINEAYANKAGLSGLLPMSMRTQAHEIIRTWAFYTIVRSLYHTGKIPWKQIMICGFVLAKKGEKISKSKGNAAASPKELINTHGADVLRYWAAGAKLGTDTFFSQDELSEARRFIIKLYNAAKFCLAQLEDYTPALPEELPATDRWMLARLEQTIQKARTLMQSYEIGLARHEIDMLFWSDFCDHYLELCKDRLYNPRQRGETARRAAQYTLYHSLLGILKMYAVYMPHITEYLYQYYFRAFEKTSSLHLTMWSGSCKNTSREEETALFDFGEAMKQALFAARKYKSTHNLSRNTTVDKISIQAAERLRPFFSEAEKDILSSIRAEGVEYTAPSGQEEKR